MIFNFLTPYPSQKGELPTAIHDLNIERMLRYLITDSQDLKYILSILSQFETNRDNIVFRQDLFKDLVRFQEVEDCLFSHLTRLQQDYADYMELQDRFLKMTFTTLQSDEHQLKVVLSELTKLTLELLNSYQKLYDICDQHEVGSEALRSLRAYLSSKLNQDGFEELKSVLHSINAIKGANVHLRVTLNEHLHIEVCQILEKIDGAPIKQGFFRKLHSGVHVLMDKPTTSTFSSLYKQGLMSMVELILTIYGHYFEPLYRLKDDVKFYQFGMEYHRLLNELSIKNTLPQIKEREAFEFNCTLLADPLIGISAYKGSHSRIEVVPNSISLDEKTSGILIKGENNTGKSVFLRSIGIAIVFSQAGLFVCSSSASISIRNKLFTLFSSKEDPQQLGGRFEKEVQYFSKIIHEIDPYSCLLINEIFQSTSTNEAENALIDILNYLSKRHTLWIFVTHLTGLFSRKEELGSIRGLETVYNDSEKYTFKDAF